MDELNITHKSRRTGFDINADSRRLSKQGEGQDK